MWERLPEPEGELDRGYASAYSWRMRVPEGWLVRTIVSRLDGGAAVHQVFVEDSTHSWELNKASGS